MSAAAAPAPPPAPASPRAERRRFLLVLLAALALAAPTVRHRNLGDCGGSSRMATAESLVERGTFAIDGSTFAYTCDVLVIDGRRYSDKPPVLSVATAALYAPLHHALGLSFDREADPHRNRRHDHLYALLTLLVTTLAHALLVALADRAAGESGLASRERLLAAASVGFATLLWPLSATFNPHPVAALLLAAGARWLWLAQPSRPAAAGASLGLLATVDLPGGLLALAGGVLLGSGRAPRARRRLALGALPPLLLHAGLSLALVGDLVPFQMHRELYDAATGHAGPTASGFPEDAGLLFYAGRNLVGALGVFSLTPLLLLALPLAAARAARTAGDARRLALHAALLFAAACALYAAAWPEAVGCSYGMRHVAPSAALLLVAACPALARPRARRAWCALALVSAVLAAGGVLAPVTCAGFVSDARGLVPARVFAEALRTELPRRLGR